MTTATITGWEAAAKMVRARFLNRFCAILCGIVAAILTLTPIAPAQAPEITVGDTPQQANERIKTLSIGFKGSAQHDYVIGDGDLLSISVFDVPELTRDIRVSQTGTISIPLVPVRLLVTGLTELQSEQKIAEVLEANGLVSHAEVGVVVKEHRSRPITIVGAVMHPMVYEADGYVTLLEALAQAGGIATDAGDTVIVTRARAATFTEIPVPTPADGQQAPGAAGTAREPEDSGASRGDAPVFPAASQLTATATGNVTVGSERPVSASNTITINLNELLETGDTRNNIGLQAGDVVTVPHAGIIYVLGAVTRPGGFVVSNDRSQLTTLKVLSLAGGLTSVAKTQHAVIIRKDNQGKQTETEVDLKSVLDRTAEDIQMRPSDVLYIPDDRTKQFLLKAAELGVAVGTAVAVFRLAYH